MCGKISSDVRLFAEGVPTPPTRNSNQLHVVEGYTLDTATFSLRRDYVAPYVGADIVLL